MILITDANDKVLDFKDASEVTFFEVNDKEVDVCFDGVKRLHRAKKDNLKFYSYDAAFGDGDLYDEVDIMKPGPIGEEDVVKETVKDRKDVDINSLPGKATLVPKNISKSELDELLDKTILSSSDVKRALTLLRDK